MEQKEKDRIIDNFKRSCDMYSVKEAVVELLEKLL